MNVRSPRMILDEMKAMLPLPIGHETKQSAYHRYVHFGELMVELAESIVEDTIETSR